ncbi:hypothetical protein GGP41_009122 [Bipolaris sorokiniana]|uniref:Uncharacterized protein n=1 Tax=Cochliobolus sativus TaxID=45130 RepID=A0A8H6DTI3_COCSA|nr:hypothetical protein GGP41_009122 [Bipolaris sorokiniana]
MRSPNDMCARGQGHCHQQCLAQFQPSGDIKPILNASGSQNQLQNTHAQSTDATCTAPLTSSQRHGDHAPYRQSIPYWDDFNGIIYEIPFRKLLPPSKTSSQQADGGRNDEPQNSCAEIAGDGPHGEKEAICTVPSPSDISQEYMPDGESTKSSNLAPCVNAEGTQSKESLSGSTKDVVHAKESVESTSYNE